MNKKTKKTKFFRIAAEGMALNGEEITKEMITQMATNYNPVKYTANINVEHIRGFSLGNNGFPTLGKVLALEARNFKDVDGATKLGLYSQIEAYKPLIQAHEEKQKLGWSIEPRKFPDNGEYNLFGLASTDSPASLYTEVMEFNMLKNDDKTLLYSEYLESEFEFEEQAKTEPPKPSFFSSFFKKEESAPVIEEKTLEIPEELATELQKFSTAFSQMQSTVQQLETENRSLKTELSGLTQKFSVLESTPADKTGHPQTNNSDPIVLADC